MGNKHGTRLNKLWDLTEQLTGDNLMSIDQLSDELNGIFPEFRFSTGLEGDEDEPDKLILTIVQPRQYKWDEQCKALFYGIIGTFGEYCGQNVLPEFEWKCPMSMWTEDEVTHIIKFRCDYGS